MPDNQIVIHKMIVHKTDHITYKEPQLSDMETPIPEEVSSFLIQHIIFNREHKYTRTAQFLDAPEAELCAFSWSGIPEKDRVRLIDFLTLKFDIDWVKTAKIEKIDNGKTVIVSTEKNSLSLKLNDKETEVILKIDDARTDRFIAKLEKDELNIYTKLILKDICEDLSANPDHFIAQSKIIAIHLFNQIKRTKRISPGDLIICTFSESGNESKWLALLKLDPEDGFVGEREEVDGQIRIVLRRVIDVLPTGELQKCAFIVPNDMRESLGYDLNVLDQQSSRYAAKRLVASFFISDFLQCKVGLNQGDKTRNFVYLSRDWVDKKDWPAEDKERFLNYVSDVINNNIVDTTSVAQAVIASREEQDEYVEYIKENGLEELTFEPDPEERRKLMQYSWFEGDYDLRIKIKKDAIGPGKTLEYRKDESTNQWIITIRTTIWEDKIRRGR
jgi:hypothetical protein